MTKVINLYGGPGTGKSTTASALFAVMKRKGINCELVTEFAKEFVWQHSTIKPIDQVFVVATQVRRQNILNGQVDYIITDSPIPLGIVYNSIYDTRYYDKFILDLYSKFENIDVFLNRKKPYQQMGRFQTEQEAMSLDYSIISMLDYYRVPYIRMDADEYVVENILKILNL
jgi:adenylate kinase family enzyme